MRPSARSWATGRHLDNSAKIVAQKYTGETKSNSLEIHLTGPFQLLGREHELVVGTSASLPLGGQGPGTCEVTTTPPTTSSTGRRYRQAHWGNPSQYIDDKTRQLGSHMTARFNVTDDLNLF